MAIIQFPAQREPVKTRLTIRQSLDGSQALKCRHVHLLLFCEDRIVQCQDCGDIIDPFVALCQFADEERRFVFHCAEERAAIEEFKKIQSEWKLTTREKRKIAEARQIAKLEAMEGYRNAAKIQDRQKS